MKIRQDAWTDEDDLLLAETVLRHVREGSTQLNAFEEVGDKLNRTSAACGFRWNAVVRHRYEKALQLSKKQRKQRQRILGKDQGGKKKLLYTPPLTPGDVLEQAPTMPVFALEHEETESELQEYSVEMATEIIEATPALTQKAPAAEITMGAVIDFLQKFRYSNYQVEGLKIENERLKRENDELRKRSDQLAMRVQELEQNSDTMQEDYETLMKIMNRARKLVLLEDDERPATKFKMDRNGNLEKLAE
ncbi:MAG: RsfA family transcriptional regulator [Bacillota bacterium]|nr:RsfA family transcriptional regulator [Bacillota bacterium]MDP4170062.1 RsfA family transcriptional regulator [Bacillota bacterium]